MQERADWRVSTYSTGTGNCVEVAQSQHTILVRDTKAPEAGSLSIPPPAWHTFLTRIRHP